MSSLKDSPSDVRARIDDVRRFLSIALSVANAHTVEFYTHDVWSRLMAVSPEEVLSALSSQDGHQGAPESALSSQDGQQGAPERNTKGKLFKLPLGDK